MSANNKPISNKEFSELVAAFDSEEDLDLQILPPKPQSKSTGLQNAFHAFLDKKDVQKSSQEYLNDFKARMNNRIKTKNDLSTQQKPKVVINVDSSIAPSLHTRSKGEFSSLNAFVYKDLGDDEKQFKEGRYEYAQKQKNKEKKPEQNLKQTKLTVVNVDEIKETKQDTLMKIDGPMYPWRKKAKPEQKVDRTPKGLEYQMIKNSGYLEYERQKEKKRQEREQNRKKQKLHEEKQRKQSTNRMENTFYNLLGLTKSCEIINQEEDFLRPEKQSEGELKNLNLLEEIEQEEKIFLGDYNHGEYDEERYLQQKRMKYGLDEIVKPYDCAHAFPFVKAILGYKFKSKLQESTKTKRIPDVFTDSEVYKKTFHYLVINECIADLHQRLKKIEKDNSENILIEINDITEMGNGMTDLRVRQLGTENKEENQEKIFLLKNYSMSKNRIGVITSEESFSLENYGIDSSCRNRQNHSFTFLCMLKSPESKQEVKDPTVVVSACIDSKELDYILRISSTKRAYFYDLQKLSTSIREYMSISNVEYSYLSDHIYNPNFIDSEKRDLVDKNTRDCIENVFSELQKSFNNVQFESIREMVLRERGIVLLQGPPGTGKTSTLLGLLAAQYAYFKKIGDKRKIMICAPSNAAIDHITKRLRTEGLANGEGSKVFPKVLRLGIVETEDKDITGCSLDHICESKVVAEKNQTLKESKMTTVQIRQELIKIQKKTKSLNADLNRAQRQRKNQATLDPQKINLELKQLQAEYIRLQNLSFSFRREKIQSKKLYQEYQKNLMKDAEIVIVTLSSSGGQKMELIRGDIACLIVDEAAQATEPSLLIALQTGVQKVMLIGDPSQLPATTLSSDSNKTLFNRSLFERFIDAGILPYFLNIQYRMMPMIREYPSEKFYGGKLIDGQSVVKRSVPQSLRGFAQDRSVIFIDIKSGQQKVQESSFCNYKEANFITKFLKRFNSSSNGISIGVITPYQAQRKLLMKETEHLERTSPIMINTIDSFQGQQKDLILISTVRSNDRKQIGFLMDERRINVSITRAKYAMIIIGNGDTLGSNQIWDGYLKSIESKKLYFEINNPEDEDKILSNLPKKDYFNHQSIRRRFYKEEELTFDPRKIKVDSFGENDLKKKPRKADSQPVNPDFPMKKGPQSPTLDYEYQAEELIKKKRKKQEEAQEYENAIERMKAVEQEKAKDDFYKFLFQ